MHLKFILADSLAELQKLSSGRFYTDPEFLSEHYTRVMVIGDNVNFESLYESIQHELNSTLLSRNEELTYSLFTNLPFNSDRFYHSAGREEFMNLHEINPLTDYFIQYADQPEFLFRRNVAKKFDEILPELRDDIISARRLSQGIEICKDAYSSAFLVMDSTKVTNTTPEYIFTSSDIIADDWVNCNYTLYPTTLKYDRDNSMCKIYYDLYNDKKGLPFAEIFDFITNGRDRIDFLSYNKVKQTKIVIATRIKDVYDYFSSVLNHIAYNNLDLCKETNIELFDPSIPVESPVLSINTPALFETYDYGYGRKPVKLIIDTDTISQEQIEVYESMIPKTDILYISFSYMI